MTSLQSIFPTTVSQTPDPVTRTRREFLKGTAVSGVTLVTGATLTGQLRAASATAAAVGFDARPFRTPYKYNRYLLTTSTDPASFDSQFVLDPFVFRAADQFYMVYLGFDGTGYQTGLAESSDLLNWRRADVILRRDPSSPYTRYNIALSSILRDDELGSAGTLRQVNGRYLASWHAYPKPGVEAGAAVIGLAWSDDFRHWQLGDPILRPEDGAHWEQGGLYKSHLVKSGDTYYVFYNAKNMTEGHWHEQIGVATSTDLRTWRRYSGNPIIRNGARGTWDAQCASNPFVVRNGTTWAVFYFGGDAEECSNSRELLALGPDPFHFSKVPEVMVDLGSPGSIDDSYAHHGCLISWQGDVYHFYVGFARGQDERPWRHGITVARSRPW